MNKLCPSDKNVIYWDVDEFYEVSNETHNSKANSDCPTMSEKLKEFIDIPQQFIRDGNQFLTRCTKPSQKEFIQICRAVAVGFAVMGFIGYFVKLIHIPINNILVGGA